MSAPSSSKQQDPVSPPLEGLCGMRSRRRTRTSPSTTTTTANQLELVTRQEALSSARRHRHPDDVPPPPPRPSAAASTIAPATSNYTSRAKSSPPQRFMPVELARVKVNSAADLRIDAAELNSSQNTSGRSSPAATFAAKYDGRVTSRNRSAQSSDSGRSSPAAAFAAKYDATHRCPPSGHAGGASPAAAFIHSARRVKAPPTGGVWCERR